MEHTQDSKRLIESIRWHEQSRADTISLKSACMPQQDAEKIAQFLNDANSNIGVSLIEVGGVDSHRIAIKDEKEFLKEFPKARISELRHHDTRFRAGRESKSEGVSI